MLPEHGGLAELRLSEATDCAAPGSVCSPGHSARNSPAEKPVSVAVVQTERLVSATFVFVVSALLSSALYASLYARGLYQDGAYYLFRLAEHDWFWLGDPARTTVQVLRQAPLVLLARFIDLSLFTRAQIFSFIMLALPVLLIALCWFIAPRQRKVWSLFPVLHLLIGYCTTSFEAVGEAAIGASYIWVVLFLLLFRTHKPLSQALFLLLCVPVAQLHEGALLCMPVLLLACALRASQTGAGRDRIFLQIVAVLFMASAVYEARWIVFPRFLAHREAALQAIFGFEFLVVEGRWNLPVVTGFMGLAAIALTIALYAWKPMASSERSATAVAIIFAGFALTAIIVALRIDGSLAPLAQARARYNPIFATTLLGLTTILMWKFDFPQALLKKGPVLAIIVTLTMAQIAADLAATQRWAAYVADFEHRLQTASGLVAWETTSNTGDPERDRNWKVMSVEWTLPIFSVIMAPNGVVNAIFDYPAGDAFRPLNPHRLAALPKLRGVTYQPYSSAVEKQGEAEAEIGSASDSGPGRVSKLGICRTFQKASGVSGSSRLFSLCRRATKLLIFVNRCADLAVLLKQDGTCPLL